MVSLEQVQVFPTALFSVFHLTLVGTQQEIGRQMARVALESLSGRAEHIDDGTRHANKARMYAEFAPILAARSRGIAEVLGDRRLDEFSLSLTEVPAVFGCSSLSCSGSGGIVFGRNFDFTLRSFAELSGIPASATTRPFIDPVILLDLQPQDTGYRTVCLVAHDLCGGVYDGMNEHGLCVAVLAVTDGMQMPSPEFVGFDELMVPRLLLESCRTVDEAAQMFPALPKLRPMIPVHYHLCDASGRSAVLEWNAESGQYGVVNDSGGFLACTNHFLSPAGSSTGLPHFVSSQERHTLLSTGIDLPVFDPSQIEAHLARVELQDRDAVGRFLGGTLWRSLFSPAQRKAEFIFRDGRQNVFAGPRIAVQL